MEGMTARSVGPESRLVTANPEVTTKAKRRRFSAAYKLRILRKAGRGANRGASCIYRRRCLQCTVLYIEIGASLRSWCRYTR